MKICGHTDLLRIRSDTHSLNTTTIQVNPQHLQGYFQRAPTNSEKPRICDVVKKQKTKMPIFIG